ncbi:MAG: membrane dipeptidase [Acidobacteria bacterium]|nr:membrane dipeptidase [Acidobacteriota bacterium]MCA1638727.1 membrane dipeptidase [Acidobacteriota bacterium]
MKNKLILSILPFALIFIFILQTGAQTAPPNADQKLWQQALKIHQKAVVIDGHNDIPSPMVDEDFDLATNSVGKFHRDGDPFHTDLQRLKQSGITGEFFSIYVSGSTLKTGGAMRRAMDLIDATNREVEKHPNALVSCTTAAEIRRAKKQNKVCVLMGIEGGYVIENSLYALRNFYRLGIRYMTLTHNVTHDWADAHRDEAKNNGLSDFGKEVVREMNRLGMLVDISHVSEKTMSDVLEVSTAPIIASHSSARGVANHTRNVPDAILKRVATNGGVIMINFYPSFLDERTNAEENERSKKLKPQLDALRDQYKNDQQAYNAAERKLLAENPIYVPTYARIVDHIDHIKKVAGIDYVGIGSDFDGVPFLPAGMNGAEDLPLITYEMLRRGYSEADIRKVLGENFLRAFTQAEKVARIESRKISGEGSLKKIK